jgi:hypothetical protein
MPPSTHVPSYREILVISLLIIGVGLLALMPALYLVFHALQWQGALFILELLFPPALCLGGLGALLAYQRSKARQAALADSAHPQGEHEHTLDDTPY